jgi:hypothetical protein
MSLVHLYLEGYPSTLRFNASKKSEHFRTCDKRKGRLYRALLLPIRGKNLRMADQVPLSADAIIESLRKSRTSRMRLLGIAQNDKVFAVFPLCFCELNAPSGLCDTVLHSYKWVSGRCATLGGRFSGHHSSSTQTSHTFRVLHTAVEAQMRFLHPPVLVLGSNYPSIDLVSQ